MTNFAQDMVIKHAWGLTNGTGSHHATGPTSATASPKHPTSKHDESSTTMCEANETLQRLRYELDLMWGNGIVNISRLKQLAGTDCPHHQEGHE